MQPAWISTSGDANDPKLDGSRAVGYVPGLF
jgi:hypothetical protein